MPKNKYTVTAPDGEVINRTSDRVYTHAVLFRVTKAYHEQSERDSLAYRKELIAKMEKDLAENTGPTVKYWIRSARPHWFYRDRADVESDLAKAKAELEAWVSVPYEGSRSARWGAKWCGRHDLAMKTARGMGDIYETIIVVGIKR